MIARLIAAYLRWRLRNVWADIDAAHCAIQHLRDQRAAWINDAAALERKLLNMGGGRIA